MQSRLLRVLLNLSPGADFDNWILDSGFWKLSDVPDPRYVGRFAVSQEIHIKPR